MRILYLIIIAFIVFIYFLINKKYDNNSILSLKKSLQITKKRRSDLWKQFKEGRLLK